MKCENFKKDEKTGCIKSFENTTICFSMWIQFLGDERDESLVCKDIPVHGKYLKIYTWNKWGRSRYNCIDDILVIGIEQHCLPRPFWKKRSAVLSWLILERHSNMKTMFYS